MLVYIAHGGATTADIFRRPGSAGDVAVIVADLAAGRLVDFTRYNFCTLASVAKKFLLRIPGGLFGADVENRLLGVLRLNSRAKKYETINSIITHLPLPTQRLLSLLLGTWFRIVSHSEYNAMSSDAVAKNVATSVFHGVGGDVERLQSAVQVLQILIDDFSVVGMLGAKNIQYFADVSRTRTSAEERRSGNSSASSTLCLMASSQCLGSAALSSSSSVAPRASLAAQSDAIVHVYPPTPSTPPAGRTPSSPRRESSLWVKQQLNPQSSASAPDVNKMLTSPSRSLLSSGMMSSSLTRFDSVKRRQLMRMKMRSHWFLSPNANNRPEMPRETTSLIWMDGASKSRPFAHNLSSSSFNDAILSNYSSKLLPDPSGSPTAGFPRFLVPAAEAKPGPAGTYSPRLPSTNGH